MTQRRRGVAEGSAPLPKRPPRPSVWPPKVVATIRPTRFGHSISVTVGPMVVERSWWVWGGRERAVRKAAKLVVRVADVERRLWDTPTVEKVVER